MGKNSTLKVSKKTLKRLHQLVGELTKEKGRRISLEDAIVQLLEEKEKHYKDKTALFVKIEKDRKDFLNILDETFHGAGPDDFKEYDFEDLGLG